MRHYHPINCNFEPRLAFEKFVMLTLTITCGETSIGGGQKVLVIFE